MELMDKAKVKKISKIDGLSVIPILGADGKNPNFKGWQKYCLEKAPFSIIDNNTGNVGICCGFDGLLVLDVDNHRGDADNLLAFLMDNFDFDGFPITKTKSGGYHIYFKSPSPGGSQKLALYTKPDGKKDVLIETKGKGGQVVYYPNFIQGDISSIPTITAEERNLIIEIAKSLDETGKWSKKDVATKPPPSQTIANLDAWAHKQHGFHNGNRNHFITQLAGACHRSGVDEASTLNHCLKYAEEGFTHKEIEATVKSIYRNTAYFGTNPMVNENQHVVNGRNVDQIKDTEDFEGSLTVNQEKNKKIKIDPFPVDIFPKPIQEVITECNNTLNFVPDFSCTSVLAALSVSIGNNYCFQVKRGWMEKANLYLMQVGNKGVAKTHPIKFLFKPIDNIDKVYYHEYEAEYERFLEYNDTPKKERGKEKVKEPKLTQTIIKDSTPEALTFVLRNNPKGVIMIQDESSGWLNGFDKYKPKGGSEQSFYVSLWSNEAPVVNRKSSQTLRVNEPFFSLIGNIQPALLKQFTENNRSFDGFLDRIFFAYPDVCERKDFSEEEVPEAVINTWHYIINSLCKVVYAEPVVIIFSPESKNLWKEWFRENNKLIETGYPEFAKLDVGLIRIALILHVANIQCGEYSFTKELPLSTMINAIKVVEYFRSTIKKVLMEINNPIDNIGATCKLLNDKGMSLEKIGDLFGISKVAVHKKIKKINS